MLTFNSLWDWVIKMIIGHIPIFYTYCFQVKWCSVGDSYGDGET